MLKLAMGTALLVTATQVVAVSLGATQGDVIIGRPLDLLVQSNITAAEAASGMCLDAEVLYGDTRIAPSAVETAIQQLGAEGQRAIRITVAQPVNEPIVTVTVRAGCTTSFRRSYTLLADVEPALAAAAAATARLMPVAPASRPVTQVPQLAVAIRIDDMPAPGSPGVLPGDALGPETPIVLAAPAPRPATVTRMLSKITPLPTVGSGVVGDRESRQAAGSVVAEAPAAPSGPRLQLDPVDLSALAGSVAADASSAPDATGPVQMSQDLPSEVQVALAQQQALQQEVETLRAEQERMRLAIETLNAQLRDAQQIDPATDSMAYARQFGLPALALLLLGGVWFVLRNRRRLTEKSNLDPNVITPWWESALPGVPPQAQPEQGQKRQAGSVKSATPVATSTMWSSDPVDGLEVAEGRESMFREVPVAAFDADRLLDLWQRIEFCCSLGQHREALEALKNFVNEHTRASEGPYLWWLSLAQQFGADSDQVAASRSYESHYQRIAPSSVSFDSPLGLADDAGMMALITESWPSAAARSAIESALASQPGDTQSPLSVRSLAVFDDLVTLLVLLDGLKAMDELPAVVPQAAADPLDELEAEFPAWQSVANIAPKPRVDFDFDMFELAPKEIQAPDDKTPKGGTPGKS